MKQKYEKPILKIEEKEPSGIEAYSAAAVPAAYPAIKPCVTGGFIIVAAVFTKYC